jgi:hypothetical protein
VPATSPTCGGGRKPGPGSRPWRPGSWSIRRPGSGWCRSS